MIELWAGFHANGWPFIGGGPPTQVADGTVTVEVPTSSDFELAAVDTNEEHR